MIGAIEPPRGPAGLKKDHGRINVDTELSAELILVVDQDLCEFVFTVPGEFLIGREELLRKGAPGGVKKDEHIVSGLDEVVKISFRLDQQAHDSAFRYAGDYRTSR